MTRAEALWPLVAISLLAGCHHPVTVITPEGQRAYGANEVAKRVVQLQDVAIALTESGTIPESTGIAIVTTTVSMLKTLRMAPAGWETIVNSAWTQLKLQVPTPTDPILKSLWTGVDEILLAWRGGDDA